MPPPRKRFDRGTSSEQRGVGYEPATTTSEQALRRILAKPVPAGSTERRTALTSLLVALPAVEKARLLTQLSNPRDPLAVLLRRQVATSTVPMLLEVLRVGSGHQTAKPAPDRLTDEALKGEFLSISEMPVAAGSIETSFEDVVAEERSAELFAEEARRGQAFTTPDPVTQHMMDLDHHLYQATQKFDYAGADLEHLKSKFERPPVDNLGGSAQGYYRILQALEGDALFEIGESAVKSEEGNVESVSGPETIGAPYLDPKRFVLAIRYPVTLRFKSGATKTYVYEIWWFADERNEYNALRSHAERAASFNPSPDVRFFLGGEVEQVRNVTLGILMRPVVGDRILHRQMEREAMGAVASGVTNRAARKAADAVLGRTPGGGGDTGTTPKRRADLSKPGAFKRLSGATPDEVAAALADPALFKLYTRSLRSSEKGRKAAADIDDLAGVIAEHTTVTPGRRVKVNPTVAAAVWALPENLRGVLIERSLGRTQYKGWYNVGKEDRGFFPDVDFALTPPGREPQQRASVKTVSPYAKSYEKKQLTEGLAEHVESLVAGTDNLRRSGQRVPTTTVDVRMPQGASVPAAALAQTLRALIPKHLKPFITIQVSEF